MSTFIAKPAVNESKDGSSNAGAMVIGCNGILLDNVRRQVVRFAVPQQESNYRATGNLYSVTV